MQTTWNLKIEGCWLASFAGEFKADFDEKKKSSLVFKCTLNWQKGTWLLVKQYKNSLFLKDVSEKLKACSTNFMDHNTQIKLEI